MAQTPTRWQSQEQSQVSKFLSLFLTTRWHYFLIEGPVFPINFNWDFGCSACLNIMPPTFWHRCTMINELQTKKLSNVLAIVWHNIFPSLLLSKPVFLSHLTNLHGQHPSPKHTCQIKSGQMYNFLMGSSISPLRNLSYSISRNCNMLSIIGIHISIDFQDQSGLNLDLWCKSLNV